MEVGGEPMEHRLSPTSLCLLCIGLTSMVAHCGLVLVGRAWHSLVHHDLALGHYQGTLQLPGGDPVWEQQKSGESGLAHSPQMNFTLLTLYITCPCWTLT